MTFDDASLERLLAEHAAAEECGLLAGGPFAAERNRLAEEMAKVSGKRAGAKTVGRPWQSRWAWLAGAAAAMVALAVGLAAWLGRFEPPNSPENDFIVQNNPPPPEPPVEFLNGRGRLVALGENTRYTLVDAGRGQVRLDQGELFVELPDGEGLQADIETPAGTASAMGTSFYAHYGETTPESPLLTVAVVGGYVEVRNTHGQELAGAGEVVRAEENEAPKRHGASPFLGMAAFPEREWWRFGNVMGLLHRPEVQAELRLTEEQKKKLHRPPDDDCREVQRFFRDFHRAPPQEQAKKAAEFRAAQEKKIAAILNAEQVRRLGQILLQQQGYAALANPEAADLLELSEEQRAQVEAVVQEVGRERRTAFSWRRGNGRDFGKRMDELRRKESEKLAALLTDAQKEQWQEMVGAPFALARPPFGFGMNMGGPPFERPRPPAGFGLDPLSLLAQKSVQEEMKLSEEQVKKITELAEKRRGSFRDFQELGREERRKKREEQTQAEAKAVQEIVTADQLKRVRQIALQQRGLQAFDDAAIAEALKLSQEQKDKIKTILEDLRKEMHGLFRGGNFEEARTQMETLRKETGEKIQEALTDEQRTQWKEMTGAPFQGEIRRPGFGGGFRRPPRP